MTKKKPKSFSITLGEGDDIDAAIRKIGDVWKALVTAKLRYIGITEPLDFVMEARPLPGKSFKIKSPKSKTKKEKR